MSKHRAPLGRRRIIAAIGCTTVLGTAFVMPSANAATILSPAPTFTAGGVSHNGAYYAGRRSTITLTAVTDAKTKCVVADGMPYSNTPTTTTETTKTWTLHGVAAPSTTPDGIQTVRVFASEGVVKQQNNVTSCDMTKDASPIRAAYYTLDNTAPTLTGAPTAQPNGDDGWYTGDVTIAWTAEDAGSGVTGSPSNTTITGEGTSLTASSEVRDRVGNLGTGTSPTVKIDRTAPLTQPTAPVTTDWNNVDQTVVLNPSDNGSGVAATYFKVDGGARQSGTTVGISTEGTHTLEYWSVDAAGNVEQTRSATIKIDKTSPTINHTKTPASNAAGWNNENVTVKFECADNAGGSGIQSCTGVVDGVNTGVTHSTEGKALPATGTAVDHAGNSVEDPAKVNLDKTKPTIDAAPTRVPDSNGWYNADVSVNFTYEDSLSGIASNGVASETFGEGANQSVSVSATDTADNSSSKVVSGIDVDKTAPTTTSDAPSAWQRGPVTVTFSGKDQTSLSGLDYTEYSVGGAEWIRGTSVELTTDAVHSISFRSADKAGNEEAPKTATVSIDTVAPTVTDGGATAAADGRAGWYTSAVENTFTAEDLVSGLADPTQATITKSSGTAEGSAIEVNSGGVSDEAGNTNPGLDSAAFKIDLSAPTVTAGAAPAGSNTAGWYRTAVTASFTAEDLVSGLADPTQATITKSTGTAEGAAVKVDSGSVADVAGHSNTGVDSPAFKIDLTAPSAPSFSGVEAKTYTTAPAENTIGCTATDGVSGLAGCRISGYSSVIGTHTLKATATDNAGHTSTSELTYTIASPWVLKGFSSPIGESNSFVRAPGQTAPVPSTTTVWQTAKGGSTVPLKFEVFNNSVESTNIADVKSFAATKLTNCTGSTNDPVDELAPAGSSSLRYDLTDGQFIQNWKTTTVSGDTCYRVTLTTQDGSSIHTFVKTRK